MRLLRGLAGRVLACGCLLGVYETYGGRVVSTVDAVGPSCADPRHRLHKPVAGTAENPAGVGAAPNPATPPQS